MRRKKRLTALMLALLLLGSLLTVPAAAAEVQVLTAPVLDAEAATITSDSVMLSAAPSTQDPAAAVQYRMSQTGTVWNSWKNEPSFTGLKSDTTYYFQARYVASDPELWANSPASPVQTLTTLVYVEPERPQLDAPVLKSSIYLVKNNEIQVNSIETSTQDPDAVKLYRMSSDGSNWGPWQTSQRFTGLKGSTMYYFQAMYQSSIKELWADSDPSNIVAYTTKADSLTVKIRVIGSTLPEGVIDFSADEPDYSGAVHQNWIQTTVYEGVATGTRVYDFLCGVLKSAGFEVTEVDLVGTSIKAPELFGGQTLAYHGYQDSKNSGWVYNVYTEDGTLRLTGQSFGLGAMSLKDGDSVVLYYVFDQTKEVTGKRTAYADAWLKATPDASLEDYELAYGTEDLIDRIGLVTGSSGSQIEAARTAYDALTDLQKSLVRNYAVLEEAEEVYSTVDGVTKLSAPVLNTKAAIRPNVITVSAVQQETEDPYAGLQYRISPDGQHWSAWQNTGVFKQLRSSTTYYLQARYWPSDVTKFEESDPSETLSFTTAKAAEYTASTRAEWVERVANAPTDGTEIIIRITGDIDVGVSGIFTTTTPGGSNITMVGAGGSLLSTSGGQLNNGICVGNGATLTLRDLTYTSIGPWGEAYGIDQQTGNANFGSMIYIGGSNCTVNLENVTMYGDCTQTGALISNDASGTAAYENNTINIYSGAIDQLGGGSVGDITGYKPCLSIAAKGSTVNLRPTGDIVIEGVILYDSVYVIPEPGHTIQAASVLSGDFTGYTDLEAELQAMNTASDQIPYKVKSTSCGGLRLETGETGTAIPQKLAAPQVTADDFTIDKAHVVVPSDPISTEQKDAVLQYRVIELNGTEEYQVLPYQKWMSRPMKFEINLKEDQEYRFELRFNAIGGDYCNSDLTAVTLRTGFTSRQLTAPRLVTADDKTTDTIVLASPTPSAQDAQAAVQYRISTDGETWNSPWQDSPAFCDLQPATVYYFQARYVPESYLWETSEAGNVLQVMTKYKMLEAPVLSAQQAAAEANAITLQAPVSQEDPNAAVEYRAAKTAEALAEAPWQSSPVFPNLQAETDYYFQARFIAASTGWLNSAAGAAITVKTAEPEHMPTFVVSETSGNPGDTVQLTVSVQNNPGLTMAMLTVQFDSTKLELQSPPVPGTVLTNCVPGPVSGDSWNVILYTPDQNDSMENGTLLTLSFRIKETCLAGEIPVTLRYRTGDVYNEDGDDLNFALTGGKITVTSDIAYGDVNGDGIVNPKDVTALTRWLSGGAEAIFGEASDLNQDHAITVTDLVILRRHLAGWDDYAALPYGTKEA